MRRWAQHWRNGAALPLKVQPDDTGHTMPGHHFDYGDVDLAKLKRDVDSMRPLQD